MATRWQHEIDYGCVLADEFRGPAQVLANGGVVSGGATFSRFTGFTTDGTGVVDYDPVALTDCSIVMLCSASGAGIIACTSDLVTTDAAGWCIWVDATGIHASHSDGVAQATGCTMDGDYLDGVTRVVTYTIDTANSRHMLYVDDLGVLEATSQAGGFGANHIGIGRYLSDAAGFTGTVNAIKIYNVTLSPRDHFLYNNLGDN